MNHAQLKHLIEAQTNCGNKLFYPGRGHTSQAIPHSPDILEINLIQGAHIDSYPCGTWILSLNPQTLNPQAISWINEATHANFVLKKHRARQISINKTDWLGTKSIIRFAADGSFSYTQGVVLGKDITTGTKHLHALTRRLRKKVQPQLRLLGPEHFKTKNNEHYSGCAHEIEYLMKLLDGKDVIASLDALRTICNMRSLFGNPSRYNSYQGKSHTPSFQPQKIIDTILRHVGNHKIQILEKYDDRAKSQTTN